MITKQYLGDSVYVDFDGYNVVLTTENGHRDDPRNRIVLEPEVYKALVTYVDRLETISDKGDEDS